MTSPPQPTVHPWHGVGPGDDVPNTVNAIIEIPRGGKVKYELDKQTGLLTVDRVLFSAVHYPANYGFIPQTFADDDDPLDIMVLCQEPVVPLSLMAAKPIGMMTMIDEGKRDHKIIGVALSDAEFNGFDDLQSLPSHRLEMVRRFFLDYKILENKSVEVEDFEDAETAYAVINDAVVRYKQRYQAS
ncbi:inorganic diphosphatase [Rhodopirellula maiorica SM1]|uniref:Inorganic pyrophosphatase n=1 Tax=Rhodopirellula maiorica SM1 TaxID=1265738 RepID=M5RI50_9BACT|nr:inorganic diphosphatase [Rhodopirellula maiorica]EMI18988.1 inorganic diphosphatase [Rhodopirellula maiorica SM1]